MGAEEWASHLFPLLAGEGVGQRAEAEAVQQAGEAQRAQQAVDDAAEAEALEQAADDAQHAREQQADGGDDLEEGLAQEAPEGVELLLGVGHVLELALGALDGLGDGAGELKRRKVSNMSSERWDGLGWGGGG